MQREIHGKSSYGMEIMNIINITIFPNYLFISLIQFLK